MPLQKLKKILRRLRTGIGTDRTGSGGVAVTATPSPPSDDFDRAHENNVRGNVLREAGRLEEALSALNEAARLCPAYGDALTNRAHVLADLGRVDDAIHGYRAALAASPGYVHAMLPLAKLLLRTGRHEESLALYDAYLKEHLSSGVPPGAPTHELPSIFEACYYRSQLHLEQGHAAQAVADLQEALRLISSDRDALRKLADLLRRTGRQAEAAEAYAALLRLMDAYRPEHLDDSGWTERVSGRSAGSDKAARDYDQLLVLFHLTKLCSASRYQEARALLLHVLATSPFEPWPGLVLLSSLFRTIGKIREADLAAQGVVEISDAETAAFAPDARFVLSGDGTYISIRVPEPDRAPDMLGRLVAAHLKEGRVLYSSHGLAVFDREARLVRDLSHGLVAPLAAAMNAVPVVRVPGRVLALLNPWSDAFFHWMYESLPKVAAALDGRAPVDVFDRVALRAVHPFHLEMLAALGIGPERVLNASATGKHIQCEELIIVNGFEVLPPENYVDRSTLGLLRGLFLKADAEKRTRRIFVDRKSGNQRRIVNHAEVLELVRRYGFETVYPEDLTIAGQALLFNGCEAIVAPAGAALSNLVYCSKGVNVCILYPEGTPWKTYEQFCDYTGARLARLDVRVERGAEEYLTDWIIPTNANLRVDLSALENQLRLMCK